ncbi:S-layer homology domain-containing protein [Paenibacillus naphthalenovorans]|uniref:SLH domain-containing protein n=1 Tax=Paenibacillus naphthalenovorans TaxID=162209 RepID=A0A0U2UNH1_9BACL|nr:S-layer homology domain-containing protein [Paenibacillus naphthalenovorans]ALS24620.1 SLH domain-containing protein [Paenibacillus naphthalenovorans]
MKKMTTLLITFVLLFGTVGAASAALPEYGEEWQNAPANSPTVSFTDLPPTHWAYKYIAEMVNRKVIDGYPDKKFRPDNTIIRAEFAKIMLTASGIQAKKVNYSSFSDIPVTNWASPFVEAVKDYMSGYRTASGEYIFNPASPALREDITVALVKLKGYDMSRLPDHSTIQAMFKDYDGISESAKDYVAIAVENGLVSGFPDETFRPQATVTRAEATVMLWRAFQFGNDNKTIGGEQTTTPSVPPVTQPGQTPNPTSPTTNPSTPSNPQQPSQAVKFSVDTLVGGNGQGDVDGPVRMAKINVVDSMVVDKNNNVFFLDSQKKKIRKFNSSNGTVETYKTINHEFNWDLKNGSQVTHFDYTNLTPMKLAYNYANDKLYLASNVYLPSKYGTDAVIYDISTGINMAAYGQKSGRYYDFIAFPDNNSVIYGITGAHESSIFQGQLSAQADLLASSSTYNDIDVSDYYGYAPVATAFATDNKVFVFGRSKLYSVQLFPLKVDKVVDYDNTQYDSVTAHEGKFYLTSGATIYELSTDGNMSTFVDGNDLIYNDGLPIKRIDLISFDNNGDVILYDKESNAIRRINL